MKLKYGLLSLFAWVPSLLLSGAQSWAQDSPSVAMLAASPMGDYTAAAVIQVLLVAFLVIALIGGGILVVNLSLMSKRPQDWVGERDPSDVGILQHESWRETAYDEKVLPPEVEHRERRRDRKRAA